jgi:uncharacterized Zn ribbon protein
MAVSGGIAITIGNYLLLKNIRFVDEVHENSCKKVAIGLKASFVKKA